MKTNNRNALRHNAVLQGLICKVSLGCLDGASEKGGQPYQQTAEMEVVSIIYVVGLLVEY